ncbi:MAG: hypothetical protein L0287_29605 [Anaerolineae bacterium]|nr:hypothetical protein [Anaerolineae bacterium]
MRFPYLFLMIATVQLTVSCGINLDEQIATAAAPTLSSTPPFTEIVEVTDTAQLIETPTLGPTPDFFETASIKTIISTVQPTVLATYPATDGEWRVEVIRYGCINYVYEDQLRTIAYEQLKIVNLSDGTEKIVDDQRQTCDGIGMYGLGGLYWSPNNRYFYYTISREGFPETCGNYIAPTIYRLDTVTLEKEIIGGGHISPDQTKLAMWQWQENEIVIWDLDMGEVGRVSGLIPNTLDGQISWSPDGQSIVYLQTTYDCARDYGKTYMTRLDLGDLSQSLLLEYDSPGFGWLSWDTPNQIRLRDGMSVMWIYDIVSRELKTSP